MGSVVCGGPMEKGTMFFLMEFLWVEMFKKDLGNKFVNKSR